MQKEVKIDQVSTLYLAQGTCDFIRFTGHKNAKGRWEIRDGQGCDTFTRGDKIAISRALNGHFNLANEEETEEASGVTLEVLEDETAPKAAQLPNDWEARLDSAVLNASKTAMGIVESHTKTMVEETRKTCQELLKETRQGVASAQAPKILAVRIGTSPVARLSKNAPKYFGNMLVSAQLGHNILLIGPAGSGKTTSAELLAEALKARKFSSISFTEGASESWLFGRHTPNGFMSTAIMDCYEHGGVALFDEIDAIGPNMGIALNTMLENGHVTNPYTGQEVKRHKDFVAVATANTKCKGADMQYNGRNKLDDSTLRRFAGSTIWVDYDRDIERQLCPDESLLAKLWSARDKVTSLKANAIISTGCVKRIYELIHVGKLPEKTVMEQFTLVWPDGLAKQCGLHYSNEIAF